MKSMLRLLGVILLLAGCTRADSSKPAQAPIAAANTVVIDNFTFTPQTLTVAAGTTVTWINRDDVPHTVTSAGEPRVLKSPVLDTDGTFTFTFSAPGQYAYFCGVHPHMTGTVIVR